MKTLSLIAILIIGLAAGMGIQTAITGRASVPASPNPPAPSVSVRVSSVAEIEARLTQLETQLTRQKEREAIDWDQIVRITEQVSTNTVTRAEYQKLTNQLAWQLDMLTHLAIKDGAAEIKTATQATR